MVMHGLKVKYGISEQITRAKRKCVYLLNVIHAWGCCMVLRNIKRNRSVYKGLCVE